MNVRTVLFVALSGALMSGCTLFNCAVMDFQQGLFQDPSNVAIYFTATTCDGEPLAGLETKDFVISQDGEPISGVESEPKILPRDLGFTLRTLLLLDFSASVVGDGRDDLISSALVFLDSIGEEGMEISIAIFDGRSEIVSLVGFTESRSELTTAINTLDTLSAVDAGSTNLNGAIVGGLDSLSVELLEATEDGFGQGFLVVFTDGTDRSDRVDYSTMISAVDASEHSVFSIGLGNEIEPSQLREVGKDGFAFASDDVSLLRAFEEIATRVEAFAASNYVLGYCSPARSGSHTLSASVKDFGGPDNFAEFDFDAGNFGAGCDLNRFGEQLLGASTVVEE